MPTRFAVSGYSVRAYAYINIYTLAFLLLQHGFSVSSVFASLLWKFSGNGTWAVVRFFFFMSLSAPLEIRCKSMANQCK